jgi:hypothetical protein
MYFWKCLESCEIVRLDAFRESLRVALSEIAGHQYVIEGTDSNAHEVMLRWTKGHFNAREQNVKFPRFSVVYKPDPDTSHRWTATVSFTRIPHIAGIYRNRDNEHVLDAPNQERLSESLIRLQLADVFALGRERPNVGTAVGLYVYYKILQIPRLRNLAEESRYTPQGSDIAGLLRSLSELLSGDTSASSVVRLSSGRDKLRSFLAACDEQVSSSLGTDKLKTLLGAVDISAKEWLAAGRGNLLRRFLAVRNR